MNGYRTQRRRYREAPQAAQGGFGDAFVEQIIGQVIAQRMEDQQRQEREADEMARATEFVAAHKGDWRFSDVMPQDVLAGIADDLVRMKVEEGERKQAEAKVAEKEKSGAQSRALMALGQWNFPAVAAAKFPEAWEYAMGQPETRRVAARQTQQDRLAEERLELSKKNAALRREQFEESKTRLEALKTEREALQAEAKAEKDADRLRSIAEKDRARRTRANDELVEKREKLAELRALNVAAAQYGQQPDLEAQTDLERQIREYQSELAAPEIVVSASRGGVDRLAQIVATTKEKFPELSEDAIRQMIAEEAGIGGR